MFKAELLGVRRGRRLVCREVNLGLEPGGLLLVLGRNGSGKSSLLRVLAGLLPAFSGTLFWQAKPIRDMAAHQARLHYLGHLDALKPQLTVGETLAYWGALRGMGSFSSSVILDEFGLGKNVRMRVAQLSAGQKRRLALARLAIGDAPLWLLDEPTTSLDEAGQILLTEYIDRHRAKGGMAVIATHHAAAFRNAPHLSLDEKMA